MIAKTSCLVGGRDGGGGGEAGAAQGEVRKRLFMYGKNVNVPFPTFKVTIALIKICLVMTQLKIVIY